MDYDEEDNGVSGSIPEFGAIFMSNVETKRECIKRKVFALPPTMAEFVKHVKAGMVLFLFEYKRRQLFGVYQASTDGAIDIVPHGFKYLGRHYPAQVWMSFLLFSFCCEDIFFPCFEVNPFHKSMNVVCFWNHLSVCPILRLVSVHVFPCPGLLYTIMGL